jgi:hypothetical protein
MTSISSPSAFLNVLHNLGHGLARANSPASVGANLPVDFCTTADVLVSRLWVLSSEPVGFFLLGRGCPVRVATTSESMKSSTKTKLNSLILVLLYFALWEDSTWKQQRQAHARRITLDARSSRLFLLGLFLFLLLLRAFAVGGPVFDRFFDLLVVVFLELNVVWWWLADHDGAEQQIRWNPEV